MYQLYMLGKLQTSIQSYLPKPKETKNGVSIFKLENSIGNSQFGKNDAIKYVDTFYVRLQGKVIYFTETDADTLVLAAIHYS